MRETNHAVAYFAGFLGGIIVGMAFLAALLTKGQSSFILFGLTLAAAAFCVWCNGKWLRRDDEANRKEATPKG